MEEILKKKNIFKKIIKNQILVSIISITAMLFVIITSSFAVFNRDVFNTENDVIIRTGNLEVVISSQSATIEQNYTTLGVPDDIGMTYEPYLFTVKNTGEAKIAYYEVRLVDKEFESKLMPHKCISYSISVNGGEYSSPQNLGDDSSYIYIGTDLEIGETDSFKLKLWVNEEWGMHANNKTLKSLIEVTLYNENPIRNHIMYDSQGGSKVTKTNIIAKRISMTKPLKKGYDFLGWSTKPNGEVEYLPDDLYKLDTGITLYAVWEEGKITYDLNGGSGNIPSNSVVNGITNLFPLKEGYMFRGWSINKDATKIDYESGDLYNGSSVTLYAVWDTLLPASSFLLENIVSYNVASSSLFAGGLVAINNQGTLYNNSDDSQEIREYRYSGSSVDNYIWYNDEMWRIVGIFKNSEGSWNLKIMRDTTLSSQELPKTFENNLIDGGSGHSYWSAVDNFYMRNTDWSVAGLMNFLNSEVDDSGIKGYYSTISNEYKNYIDENYEYYLSNVVVTNGNGGVTVIESYVDERREATMCPDNLLDKAYNNNCNIWYGHVDKWNGKIALLYPSDIGYSVHSDYWKNIKLKNYNSTYVKNSSWMLKNDYIDFEWLLSPSSETKSWVTWWTSSGLSHDTGHSQTSNVRPVINLKSDVKILAGNGSEHSPFVLDVTSIKPICKTNSYSDVVKVGDNKNYILTCTSILPFDDSTIEISDFEFDNDIMEINAITKNIIPDGYEYQISINTISAGGTDFILKEGTLSNAFGHVNDSVNSTINVIQRDLIKPVCTFAGPTIGSISKDTEPTSTQYTIECTDNMGLLSDSDITIDDFEFSNSGIVSISNITKTSITGGYKYDITVNAVNNGTTSLTLKAGVITDGSDNASDSVTSSSITVADVVLDSTPPVCVFSGPATSTIYMMKEPRSTEFYLECTDESDFNDSEINVSDFSVGNQSSKSSSVTRAAPIESEPPIIVTNVVKSTITGGFRYTITVNSALMGNATLSLKPGVISDIYGNSNKEVISSSITVYRQ